MINDDDKEQIEHALEVNCRTVVEEHLQQYMKILKDDYEKCRAVAEASEKHICHGQWIDGVGVDCLKCKALKAWKESK